MRAATYYWLNRVVVPKVQKREKKKKVKAKMSVGESFAFLAGSRCVCAMLHHAACGAAAGVVVVVLFFGGGGASLGMLLCWLAGRLAGRQTGRKDRDDDSCARGHHCRASPTLAIF